MPGTRERKKTETIKRLAALLRERLTGAEVDDIARFARQYYSGAAPEDLVELDIEDLYGAVLGHWHFAARRKPGSHLLRVYNPSYEEHGWQSSHTVIELITDDMPFLVDSITMKLARQGLTVHLILHPVIKVRRNGNGRLIEVLEVPAKADNAIPEAVIRFDVDRLSGKKELEALYTDLDEVLNDVRAVVEDWPRMRARVTEIIDTIKGQHLPLAPEDVTEDLEFLRWIEKDNFTFIGFRTYDLAKEEGQDVLRPLPESGLGIFRNQKTAHISRSFSRIPPPLRSLARAPTLLILTKSTAVSNVHRPTHMDYLGIKRFNKVGEIIGEWRFVGLYTSAAFRARPNEIPILRKKTTYVLKRAALDPSSHGGKALLHILETFPRDELFEAAGEELYEMAIGILHVQGRHKLSLFLREDLFSRFVTALVYVPRDRYNTDLRQRFQDILTKALGGEDAEYNVEFTEPILARLHFTIHTRPGKMPEYDVSELEARMAEAMLSWEDELHIALHEKFGEGPGNKLIHRYNEAFPAAYREDFPVRTAVLDITHLESITESNPLSMYLYSPLEGPENLLRFKVYGCHQPMALSDVLPILERMGVRVLEARPYEIEPREGKPFWILDFDMTTAQGIEIEVLEVKDIFQEAFARVCSAEMENDGFNRLVLSARLNWRIIVLLRAICKYLLQTGVPFSQAYMERSLAVNPGITRLLALLFHARFDPGRQDDDGERVNHLVRRIEQTLDTVAILDEDRILRAYLALIQSMLRTNYFQKDAAGHSPNYLSFKLDPAKLSGLTLPRPMYEVFVYSPHMEGLHLRGGPVARGGIRWSDRREDFRTEILGLMKAQMVKNAVIVPVGAKGGFVTKRLPSSAGEREAVQREVEYCYQTFIRGLLDITDNLTNGDVTPPRDVVRYDGNDPYLVVAADKGTAAFSDIANRIAADYGFWLGDAFASGGSTGYDHKKIGITARGAWESVKRHFREVGIDIQNTSFTAIGIGDMSGDVFGNGMLQSRCIRLLAAFNHLHIFIDPDPDPPSTYAERMRLFKLPGSTWMDFNPKLISPGGGVYPRSAKSITLSAEARRALGADVERLTPNELIKAILRAPVDLWWNGGIGTYVKASTESDADVGDRGNDAVRIDATELRCRVVGEGGNLGFTQAGRIEFARQGGLINTDAIDNSGGVDCSDHEVNIKILLHQVVNRGDMTVKQCNQLLAAMTDEVAALVLRHNYLQTEALSIAAAQAPYMLDDHTRLIHALEHEGRLKRKLEFLPSDKELAERRNAHSGLSRPEISVLLAYGKIKLYQELLDSDISEDSYLSHELQCYFPTPLRQRFSEQMASHPLRREIIATQITNSLVDRMGGVFFVRIQEDTGEQTPRIARAYTAAREIFRIQDIWQGIESLDNKVPSSIQIAMITETRRLLDSATLWLLRHRRPHLDIAATMEQFCGDIEAVAGRMQRLIKHELKKAFNRRARQLSSAGVPQELAQRIVGLDHLYPALDLSDVARCTRMDITQVAEAYFGLDNALELYWLRDRIGALPRDNHWQRRARAALRDELYATLRALTEELLRITSDIKSTGKRINTWLDRNRTGVEHCRALFMEIKSSGTHDLAMLSVVMREVRALLRHDVAGRS